jgi:hypothetical protein
MSERAETNSQRPLLPRRNAPLVGKEIVISPGSVRFGPKVGWSSKQRKNFVQTNKSNS